MVRTCTKKKPVVVPLLATWRLLCREEGPNAMKRSRAENGDVPVGTVAGSVDAPHVVVALHRANNKLVQRYGAVMPDGTVLLHAAEALLHAADGRIALLSRDGAAVSECAAVKALLLPTHTAAVLAESLRVVSRNGEFGSAKLSIGQNESTIAVRQGRKGPTAAATTIAVLDTRDDVSVAMGGWAVVSDGQEAVVAKVTRWSHGTVMM
jgi:hypothetical protein